LKTLMLLAVLLSSAVSAQTAPITVPPNFTAPQEQASALAVPAPSAAKPSSIMAIIYCNKISGLAVIDTEGTIHPVSIEGLSKSDVLKIMQTVPADRVKAANMGCPNDVSKDTTVL